MRRKSDFSWSAVGKCPTCGSECESANCAECGAAGCSDCLNRCGNYSFCDALLCSAHKSYFGGTTIPACPQCKAEADANDAEAERLNRLVAA